MQGLDLTVEKLRRPPKGGETRATSANAVEDKTRDAISPHEIRMKQGACACVSKGTCKLNKRFNQTTL